MGSTSFLGFSCPNLLLLFFCTCYFWKLSYIFSQVLGLSLGLDFIFSVPYFELACDHAKSFLCLEE